MGEGFGEGIGEGVGEGVIPPKKFKNTGTGFYSFFQPI